MAITGPLTSLCWSLELSDGGALGWVLREAEDGDKGGIEEAGDVGDIGASEGREPLTSQTYRRSRLQEIPT